MVFNNLPRGVISTQDMWVLMIDQLIVRNISPYPKPKHAVVEELWIFECEGVVRGELFKNHNSPTAICSGLKWGKKSLKIDCPIIGTYIFQAEIPSLGRSQICIFLSSIVRMVFMIQLLWCQWKKCRNRYCLQTVSAYGSADLTVEWITAISDFKRNKKFVWQLCCVPLWTFLPLISQRSSFGRFCFYNSRPTK